MHSSKGKGGLFSHYQGALLSLFSTFFALLLPHRFIEQANDSLNSPAALRGHANYIRTQHQRNTNTINSLYGWLDQHAVMLTPYHFVLVLGAAVVFQVTLSLLKVREIWSRYRALGFGLPPTPILP